MNEESKPPHGEQPQDPLQYWHSNHPAPLHPALLTLLSIGGFLLGAGITIVAGFFLGLGMLGNIDGPMPHKLIGLAVGIAIDLATLGIFYRLTVKVRRGKTLALELRRRGMRFFTIGFLLGCGLACLMEGICFTAAGVNS